MINFTSAHSSHVLRVDSVTELESLDAGLWRFWELESLGILKDEQSVHKQFTPQIAFKQGRYEVRLPWKDSHPHLPNNYSLCCKQLNSLLKRLNQNTDELQQYDKISFVKVWWRLSMILLNTRVENFITFPTMESFDTTN